MIPVSRAEARALGSKHYAPGTVCAKGHVSARFTSCGYCTLCSKERAEAQKNRLGDYYRARYQANREKFKADGKRRQAENRAARNAKAKEWAARNPELVRAYKQKNKHKRRAVEGVFERRDVSRLMWRQRGSCAICDVSLQGKHHVDHIIPISRGGTNWCGNLQLLCATCNYRKSDKLPIQFRVDRARHRHDGVQVGRARVSPAMFREAA